ncbi:MAG: DUF3788 domain-containing protein [candidate division WOR-3 bacterium]|nr:DUF3788 domain-containing protein [candidate division WOR-3 bacterium]
MNDKYGRILTEIRKPTEKTMMTTLGTRASSLWKKLRTFLKVNYDHVPVLLFGGQKYGWCFKYRRKNKTLCVLFPESKAFTVLVTLGKKEIAQFQERYDDFNEGTRMLFTSAHQYHDGKWLYKRVLNKSDLRDVISLIRIKRTEKTKGSQS